MTFTPTDLDALLDGHTLSDQQRAVVTAPLGPGVVVAGAGSGKTATMVARVLWLVARGEVAAEGVLGLTFTSKAADELASRARSALGSLHSRGLLPEGPDGEVDLEPTITTYHSFAARLVRDHALRLGREPTSRLITPATSWQLAARAVGSYAGPMDDIKVTRGTVVKQVLALAGDLSEHLVDPAQVLEQGCRLEQQAASATKLQKMARDALTTQRARAQLLPIVAAYTAAKRSRDLLDFGGVVALAAELARDCPEVSATERARFPVVLLDEYQDTGSAQETLLASLFGSGHAVTAVGDPCQSIYGWRGASAGSLRRFPERFRGEQPAPVAHLSTTYRNGGRLLTLANAVSAPLRSQGLPVPELLARVGHERAGQIRCGLLSDVETEARWVADQVRNWLVEHPVEQGPSWARAAVLCRKRTMFPRLREAFEALGVPVEVVGLGGLLQVPEVTDLVATLRVLDDPLADRWLLRLLTGPRWRIGPRDLAALGRRARSLVRSGRPPPDDPIEAVVLGVEDAQAGSLVDALDDLPESGLSPEGRRRMQLCRDELRALRRRLDQPLPDLVSDVERTLGLDVEVAVRPRVSAPAAARADLDAFVDAAAQFASDAAQEGTGEAVLTAFLAYLDAAEDEEHGLDIGTASSADTVKLMTVHAAKGLEWPLVAVPGLAGGKSSKVFPGNPVGTSWLRAARLLPFPLRGDRDDLPELAGLEPAEMTAFETALAERDAREELRLAYVAFTRAEQVLVCSGFHWGEGSTVLGPSVLLEQAHEACMQGAGEVLVWDEAPEVNPLNAPAVGAPWPQAHTPADSRVLAVAARVRELAEALFQQPEQLEAATAEVVRGWDDDLARLDEEQQRRSRHASQAVLPGTLSVSALVDLARDPDAVARGLRRPLPRRPSPTARRGTAFHAWLEREVFGMPALLDPFELPGSGDQDAGVDERLAAMQHCFRVSAWWGRTPVEIEVPFEMELAGALLRGRMDAVYRDDEGDEVVDWKTGTVPTGQEARAAAVQLAAYRLAWHRLSGLPLERVGAAFHYVADDVTHRPVDLLDEAGLAALLTDIPQG